MVAAELARCLAHRGHRVHLISTDVPFAMSRYGEEERRLVTLHRVQVPQHPLFAYGPYGLALASKLAQVAQEEGLDVVHVHYAVPHAAAAVMARDMVRPLRLAVLATLHGSDVTLTGVDPSLQPAVAHSLRRCDGVTAVSHYLACRAQQAFSLSRVQVIPDFVDVRRIHPRPDAQLRASLAQPEEAVLLHASNFRPVKNALDVVEVFARVVRRRPAVLVLCGDGPEAGAAAARLAELGLSHKAHFLGVRADVARLLAVADVFLLPSSGEGFGLAALEAMAAGVPVVGTHSGGLPEVVRHGETGLLLPVHDIEGMAQAVMHLLEPDRHQAMAQAARAWAAKAFSSARVVPRYEALYGRLVARVQRRRAARVGSLLVPTLGAGGGALGPSR
jgi:N-acetyl-alpha-D-glucosaminyl L-malate synthase BshA